jgi:hypothetical protein
MVVMDASRRSPDGCPPTTRYVDQALVGQQCDGPMGGRD